MLAANDWKQHTSAAYGCRAVTGAKAELKERKGGLDAASAKIEQLMEAAQAYKCAKPLHSPIVAFTLAFFCFWSFRPAIMIGVCHEQQHIKMWSQLNCIMHMAAMPLERQCSWF